MSFVVRKSKSRPWPVTVTLQVGDDEGNVQVVEQKFVGYFRPFSEAEFRTILDEETARDGLTVVEERIAPAGDSSALPAMPLPPVPTPAEGLETNARIFARLLDGWGKVLDESKVPIPYSKAALTALVTGEDGMAFSAGINHALTQMRFGVAPAKNAVTSLAPGPKAGAAEVAPTK